MKRNKSKGMGLKKSNGMRLGADDNYFKFNEYERKRKYLQMGSHRPGQEKPKPQPKQKIQTKPNKPDQKTISTIVHLPEQMPAQKEQEQLPKMHMNSFGSVVRTVSLYEQLLYV